MVAKDSLDIETDPLSSLKVNLDKQPFFSVEEGYKILV